MASKNKIEYLIRANSSQMRREAAKVETSFGRMDKSASQMTRTFQAMKTAGLGFIAIQVGRAALELVKLGEQAKNVRSAFNELADPGMMDRLTTSTGHMVDKLTLMQEAVKFINFGLQQSELPKFLAFAQRRALQTGESIDYMVQSIVIGLGRKSIKVIDNLALNVTAFKEAVASGLTWTEALAKTIDEDLGGATDIQINRVMELNAAWSDFRLALTGTGGDNTFLAELSAGLRAITDFMDAKHLAALQHQIEGVKDEIAKIEAITEGGKKGFREYFGAPPKDYTEELARLNEQLDILETREKSFTGEGGGISAEDQAKKDALRLEVERLKARDDLLKTMIEEAKYQDRINKSLRQAVDSLREFGEELVDVNVELDAAAQKLSKFLPGGTALDAKLASAIVDQDANAFIDSFEPQADEIMNKTDEIENRWHGAMMSMANDVMRLTSKSKISFTDIASIILRIAAMLGSGGSSGILTGIFSAIKGKATGGLASGMTLLGEAGPELVNFNQPARVYSAPATQRMLGGGGDGGQVEFFIAGDMLRGVLDKGNKKQIYFS